MFVKDKYQFFKDFIEGATCRLTADVDDLVGTANDDTFTAGLSVAGGQTLNGFDRLDGGEGTDTLNATLTGGVALDGVIENIENLYFRALNGATVNMANVAGVEQIWSDRAQADFFVNNQENLVTFGVIGGEGNANVVNYDVDSATAVAQDVVLEGANFANAAGAAQGGLWIQNGGTAEFNAINITNSGESFFSNVTSGSLADEVELNVEGSGSLQIDTALQAEVNTVNAGDFAGDLTLDLSNNASDLDVTLGAGDDSLTVNGNELDANDSIDMGAGYNTLTLGAVTDLSANFSGVTNVQALGFVETQTITAAGGTETLNVGDINKVTFEGGLNGNAYDPAANAALLADLTAALSAGDTVEQGTVTYTRQADGTDTAVDSDAAVPTLATAAYAVSGAAAGGLPEVFVTAGALATVDNTDPANPVAGDALYLDGGVLTTVDPGTGVQATLANYLAVDGATIVDGNTTYVGGAQVESTETGVDVSAALAAADATFTIGGQSYYYDETLADPTVNSEVTTGTSDADGVAVFTAPDGSLITDTSAILSTLELDSNASELTVDFEGAADESILAVSDDVSDLTLTADESAVALTVTNQADSAGDTESLQTLTLSDASTANAAGELTVSSYNVDLVDVNGLSTINLQGASGVDAAGNDVATSFTVDAAAAEFDGAVTVNISDVNNVTYDNAQVTVSETFVFGGDLVDGGTVTINDFNVTTGANADKLDFSEFGLSASDLTIVTGTSQYTITSDAFDGEIVVNTVGTPEPSFFEANAFA